MTLLIMSTICPVIDFTVLFLLNKCFNTFKETLLFIVIPLKFKLYSKDLEFITEVFLCLVNVDFLFEATTTFHYRFLMRQFEAEK